MKQEQGRMSANSARRAYAPMSRDALTSLRVIMPDAVKIAMEASTLYKLLMTALHLGLKDTLAVCGVHAAALCPGP